MLFTTGAFLFLYLPATVAGFFIAARLTGRAAAAAWLALASVYFYGYWLPKYTLLLLASVAVNYAFGGFILKSQSGTRRAWLIAAVATNLVLLAYFKYANFLLQTANAVVGTHFALLPIILPLGISFFTFTQIAYLADVHAGKVEERNPIHYLLFVTYFPHLIAGPVLHHAEMMPQFKKAENYLPRLENFAVGLAFLVVGLIKKVIIADSVAPVANNAFDGNVGLRMSAGHAWVGVLAYAYQIYFDFSGYSDMAVGLSLLVGVRLPYNFNSPYKARSIIDFWRRWHITLSRFLRDYLYFALGGNRKGRFRRHLNLLATMLLGGLWHGASWTFVIWGGLHGIFLALNHAWRFVSERFGYRVAAFKGSVSSAAAEALAAALTMFCVLVAWVFFRAKTIGGALNMLGAMFSRSPSAHMAAGDWSVVPWLVALGLLVFLFPNSQSLIDGRLREQVGRLQKWVLLDVFLAFLVGIEIVAIVLCALIAARRNSTEFIYFNF